MNEDNIMLCEDDVKDFYMVFVKNKYNINKIINDYKYKFKLNMSSEFIHYILYETLYSDYALLLQSHDNLIVFDKELGL